YNSFIERLVGARVCAIVADYDGTLCDEVRRFEPLPSGISAQIKRLLRLGVTFGVASGRGKSVREQLRRAIPLERWDRVVVGDYNGGDLGLLSDDDRPDGTESVVDALEPVRQTLLRYRRFLGGEAAECRMRQISLAAGCLPVEYLWYRVNDIIGQHRFPGVS